jgi:serine/threonine-protein kinase
MVAVKIIPWVGDGEAARREGRALNAIKDLCHPYLIPIYTYWVQNRRLYIVMELADCSLRDLDGAYREADKGGIPVTDLLRYCGETAEVLDFLNNRNVVHRDVKPDNVFVVGRHAKLGDCGMARLQEHEWQQKASLAGTVAYMAPEALDGRPNGHSDQYSLATMYSELRLGRLPFSCTTLQEWIQAHQHGCPDLEPLRDEERHVLLRALAKNDAQRYASCLEFVRALEQAGPKELEGATVTGDRGGPTCLGAVA